jgi:hypothetical protein
MLCIDILENPYLRDNRLYMPYLWTKFKLNITRFKRSEIYVLRWAFSQDQAPVVHLLYVLLELSYVLHLFDKRCKMRVSAPFLRLLLLEEEKR